MISMTCSESLDDNPDVGSIVLHRLSGVEGTSVSATSYNAPKDAKKAREHIELAAGKYGVREYMGDVARVHRDLLRKGEKAK